MKRAFAVFFFLIFATSSRAEETVPQMVIQRGHNERIERVAISPDGEYLASGASREPTKLWQAQRGEFIRDLPDSQGEEPLAWSPDGSTLVTQAVGIGVRLRQIPAGKILRTLRGVSTPLWFDGKIIRTAIFAGGRQVLRDWRIRDGKLLSTRKIHAPPRPAQINLDPKYGGDLEPTIIEHDWAFSRNGKYFAFGGRYGVFRACVWDAVSGKILHEVERNNAAFGKAAVSDDGKWLATIGENPTWRPPDDAASEAAFSRELTVRLWNLKTEKQVRVWPAYNPLDDGAWMLKFSRDGKRLFSGADGGARVHEVASGKTFSVEANDRQDVSDDDRTWASSGLDSQHLHTASSTTGKTLREMPTAMSGGDALAWSPNGKYLASGSELRIWDMQAAQLLQPPAQQLLYLVRALWKDDTTLQTENLQAANVWRVDANSQKFSRVENIKPFFTPRKNASEEEKEMAEMLDVGKVLLSPDGQLLLSGARGANSEGALNVWDVKARKLLRAIRIHPATQYLGEPEISWLPDNARFVLTTKRGLEIWSTQSGAREKLIAPPADWPRREDYTPRTPMQLKAISPDGKYLVAAGQSETLGVGVWDLASTHLLRRVLSAANNNAAFSPDGQTLALGFYQENDAGIQMHTEIWDWRDGKKPRAILPARGDGEGTLAWLPDGKRLAIGEQNAIAIYDVASKKLLARLSIGGKNIKPDASDWLITTPEGFFSAPDGGKKRVRWMDNGVLLPLDSPRDRELRTQFFQPEKVGKILGGEQP